MPKPDGVGVTGGSGAKSVFLTQDDEGNEMLCSVEEFVREHYKKEENYPEGLHAGLVTNSIFSVSFLGKSNHCLEGKSMTPCLRNTILFRSSQQLPSLLLRPFELTQCSSRALDSPRVLLPELQRYKDYDRFVAPGAEVPGHRRQ